MALRVTKIKARVAELTSKAEGEDKLRKQEQGNSSPTVVLQDKSLDDEPGYLSTAAWPYQVEDRDSPANKLVEDAKSAAENASSQGTETQHKPVNSEDAEESEQSPRILTSRAPKWDWSSHLPKMIELYNTQMSIPDIYQAIQCDGFKPR